MALKDITITGSIGSIPTQSYDQKTYISSTDEQSFPLETIIGGAGGSTPDLYGNVSSSNLIVNITQSWSGSINTPVGIVAFVDQTQNEFINGQYSGSDILVTDGELSADNPFLEFSTTIDYYTPVIYYDLGPLSTSPALSYINVPLNNFLDLATEPDNGEIYLLASITYSGVFSLGTNVTCAKISRYDSIGNDRSNVLQQLTDFRIKYSNNNILQYDIVSLVNYGTYYLYYLAPKPLGNIASGDFKYLDYTISASNSSISVGADQLITASFSTVTTNPLGYLSSSGVYTLDNTPNLRLYFTASFTSTGNGSIYLIPYPSLISTGISYNFSAGSHIFTGSFTPIENESYVILFAEFASIGYNVTNLEFNITQSTISPQSGVLDTIIFNPDFEIDFFYNDWNVLYGNADGLELDNNFMKVNYETGQTIPTNQQQILTGSAERAPVKPYNYALRAQILPRYEGVRSYQQNENVWTEGDSGSFGEEPSVQNLQTYFAFFNFVAETDYELIGKSVVNVLYLVDKDGNTITPSLLAPYYPNLIQNFPTTQNVNVQFYTYNGNPNNFTSTYPIIRAGALPVPILYSQTGSTENSSSYIGFDTLNNVPNYGTSIQIYNQTWSIGSFNNILDAYLGPQPPTVNFISPGYTSYPGVGTPPDRSIVIDASSNKTQIIPSINIYLQFNRINNFTNPFTVDGILKIYKYTNSNWSVIATSNITISQTGQYFSLSSSPQVPVNTDKYRVTLETNGSTSWGNIIQGGGTFTLTQTTPPSVQQITASYYWETGSSSKNILTGSGFTSNVYNLYQTFPSSSDYLNVLQFTVKQYDEIRFEGDENQTYVIDSVSDPFDSPDGKLYLTLNKDIVNGTNLDSFFIRRFQENPNYIILDTSFNSSNTSGFLFPEYESLDIQNNFNNIIQKLTEKGLI